MLLAATLVGYVLAATGFYILCTKTAVLAEEETAGWPVPARLTVVEGGPNQAQDVRQAA
ncbi:MAG: hypothetical protein KIS64_06320 [Fimbriimonadaceae bacterium]|nr:hypothetical protein [Fimbriimonadaceae bacterium]